jgi:FkbM family methyltransferase
MARRFAEAVLPPLSSPTICPTTLGFVLVVSKDDGVNYYYDGSYESGTLHVMSLCLRPGDVFVDVGASIGQMTFHASRLVADEGRVLAFEPHPERFASLKGGLDLNNVRNVVAYEGGLGSTNERRSLYTARASPSLVATADDHYESAAVDVMTLDQVLNDENVSVVRMMKIDVEGFELPVLEGARDLMTSPHAPIVCMEHDRHGEDPLKPLEFLRSANDYRFFNLRRRKSHVSGLVEVKRLEDVRIRDNVFCFLPAHLDSLKGSPLFADSRAL